MAFHFLIDGYNLLYALPELPPGSLQDKREALVRMLQKYRLQGNNKLTVIFDSRQGEGNQSLHRDLTVVFTAGETADEWISARVRRDAQPQTLVVVSNDQGIRLDIKGTGARFISADEFLQRSPEKPRQSHHRHENSQSEKITDEMKKRWLT